MSRYKWRKLAKDCHQLMVEYDKTRDPRRATLSRLLYQVRMGNRIPDVWYKLKELLKEKEEATTAACLP